MIVLGIDIRIYFLLFILYAFMGWLIEVVGKLITLKKFINRGFLIGPICPIYGVGAILITFLLDKYIKDPIALFVMAIFICGILEYLTSYFMEKIFHARWWDYSKRKFNINGRVCLNTIIPFGLLGMFIMYVSNPFFLNILRNIPNLTLSIISVIVLIVFIIDNIVSTNIISYLGKTTKEVAKDLDNTEEITKKVKEILLGKSRLYRRLLNAYPTIHSIQGKVKEKQKEIKRQIDEQKKEIQDNITKQKKDIKNKIEDLKKRD